MGASAFWHPAGFAAVMLLWAGTPWRREITLVAILAGYLVAEALTGWTGATELGFAAANLVEPIVILPFLVRATQRDQRLNTPNSLLLFVIGCIVAPAVSGLFAASWSLISWFTSSWRDVWPSPARRPWWS